MEDNDLTKTKPCPDPGPFPPTRDSLIQRLTSGDGESARAALASLCGLYREPILHWLLRKGTEREKAEDLTQGFMEYLLEKNRFEQYVRGPAKFRSFLLKCLERFCHDLWKKESADKRGGGEVPVSLDDQPIGMETDLGRVLDREFALAIHGRVMARLEEKFNLSGKGNRWAALRGFVLGDDPSVSYAEATARLGMQPNAVRKAVFDLRDSYCDLFQQEVAETTSPGLLNEEMRYLLTLLAQAGPDRPT